MVKYKHPADIHMEGWEMRVIYENKLKDYMNRKNLNTILIEAYAPSS
ncbi:hypothetical protein CLOHYLEM_06640 [[Clostridium] hylemonae DSM 15053]|uniref:Uncharacterized protein n=1 Tax=[Clostridium] hylemonae DSM 15053 TaxID=553973 RepID=C0C3H8_9FIRM|nr:hypothetical protein CLOHYLEM_06640 [[Clostridium] hylemonae DSM 15053]